MHINLSGKALAENKERVKTALKSMVTSIKIIWSNLDEKYQTSMVFENIKCKQTSFSFRWPIKTILISISFPEESFPIARSLHPYPSAFSHTMRSFHHTIVQFYL